MELRPEELGKLDPLALSNTITLSALVALLVRNGVLTEADLAAEVRALRAKLAGGKPAG